MMFVVTPPRPVFDDADSSANFAGRFRVQEVGSTEAWFELER